MQAEATAIYENGTLRLLTPVNLPEQVRVRVQIQEENINRDDLRRALAVLEASGLIDSRQQPNPTRTISLARRTELAELYAASGPLSEMIIAERDGR